VFAILAMARHRPGNGDDARRPVERPADHRGEDAEAGEGRDLRRRLARLAARPNPLPGDGGNASPTRANALAADLSSCGEAADGKAIAPPVHHTPSASHSRPPSQTILLVSSSPQRSIHQRRRAPRAAAWIGRAGENAISTRGP
jgi:hypothetical protein